MPLSPFAEYKQLVQDTARITDRRETINNIYLSVNSVLLGVVALVIQQSQLKNALFTVVALFVSIAGVAIARDWRHLIHSYRDLLRLRFKALRELEARDDFPGTVKIYHREDTLYDPKAEAFGISLVEVRLARLFRNLYVIAIFAIIAGSIIVNYPTLAQIFNLPSLAHL